MWGGNWPITTCDLAGRLELPICTCPLTHPHPACSVPTHEADPLNRITCPVLSDFLWVQLTQSWKEPGGHGVTPGALPARALLLLGSVHVLKARVLAGSSHLPACPLGHRMKGSHRGYGHPSLASLSPAYLCHTLWSHHLLSAGIQTGVDALSPHPLLQKHLIWLGICGFEMLDLKYHFFSHF